MGKGSCAPGSSCAMELGELESMARAEGWEVPLASSTGIAWRIIHTLYSQGSVCSREYLNSSSLLFSLDEILKASILTFC